MHCLTISKVNCAFLFVLQETSKLSIQLSIALGLTEAPQVESVGALGIRAQQYCHMMLGCFQARRLGFLL